MGGNVIRSGRGRRSLAARFAAWLGVVALALQVLTPLALAAPNAFADEDGSLDRDLMVLCSMYNMPGDEGDGDPAAGKFCPFCQIQVLGKLLVPPPGTVVPMPGLAVARVHAPLSLDAGPAPSAAGPVLSRAPPANA